MASVFRTLLNDEPDSTRAKVIAIYGILLVFNLAAWCWALVAFHRYPVLLGTAFLAYSFGLRHERRWGCWRDSFT
jgi:high-affinity nickel-transport protein